MNKKNRDLRSELMKGKQNPRWNGGVSEYPNHAELKRARIIVLKNSKGKCEICNKNADIVHHKDGGRRNHEVDNLIALCQKCHLPLHLDDNGMTSSHNRRPSSRLTVFYGMTINEIAEMFNVTKHAVYYWNRNPQKRKWLQGELKKRLVTKEGN